MSSLMRFNVTFHTPFRVGTGSARDGLDDTINSKNPLPGSSIKGLMRAASREVIAAPEALIGAVFGSEHRESPWAWTDADIDVAAMPVQARIKIDESSGTVQKDFLFIAEQVESRGATFEVVQRGRLSADGLRRQQALLVLSAMAVRQIGADRRRGLGWVTIAPTSPPTDIGDLLALVRGGTDA